MAAGLTRKQQDALEFIRSFIAERKIPPSYNEIADALGVKSKSVVCRVVDALEDRGHIRRLAKRARSIELIENDPPSCPHCPHCQREAARREKGLRLIGAVQAGTAQ